MPTEIHIWQIVNDGLDELNDDSLASHYLEKDLERWIKNNPSILGSKLLVIQQQYEIPNVGRIDLLCIDEDAKLVVVEFKRDLTSRETVAQALDYASWLYSADEDEIKNRANEFLRRPLDEAFFDTFGVPLESFSPQNHRILVVAPKLDSPAERIINYLAQHHSVDVNAIFFRYAKLAEGQEVLVRSVLVPDEVREVTIREGRPTLAVLLKMAEEKKTTKLVEACRGIRSGGTNEELAKTYGGSFRYWFKGKMIFGVNVAGGRYRPPAAELDVWIPRRISEVIELSEQEVQSTLTTQFKATEGGTTDYVVRIRDVQTVTALVSTIRDWTARATPQALAAAGD